MDGKPIRFSKLLELHLDNVVKKRFTDRQLTSELLHEVQHALREQLVNVFTKSKHQLATESVQWLADQYFKVIRVNGDKQVAELVILNEHSLASLPYHDVTLLRNLFNETKLGPLLEAEYQRRSQT
jgi:hypothetical protein